MAALHPLAAVRIGWAVTWLALLALLATQLWQFRDLPDFVWRPFSVARFVPQRPAPVAVALLWWVSFTSTVLVGVGWRTRVAGAVALASGTALSATAMGLGKLDHGYQLPLLALVVLAGSGWGDVNGLDARRGPRRTAPDWWPARQSLLAVAALMYLYSGVIKLIRGAAGDPGYMERLLRHSTVGLEGTPYAVADWIQPVVDWIYAHDQVAMLLILSAVAIELTVVVALLGRTPGRLAMGSLIAFHAAIGLLSGIVFFSNLLLLLAIAWADTLPLGKARREPAAPAADGRRRIDWSPVLPALWGVALLVPCIAVLAVLRGDSLLGTGTMARLLWPLLRLAMHPVTMLVLTFVGGAMVGIALVQVARSIVRGAARPAEDGLARVLLYDGGCGFCKRWCDWSQRRTGSAVAYQPCQEAVEVRGRAGIPDAACLHAAFFLVSDGLGRVVRVERGAGAINAVLERFPGRSRAPWRLAAMAYHLEGMRQVEDLGYSWVARNRHRLGDDACAIEPPSPVDGGKA